MSRYAILGLTFLAFIGPAFVARADDELDRLRARQEIELQKLRRTVTNALAESRTLEKVTPFGARSVLNEALSQVRDTRNISEAERASLERQLRNRLTDVDQLIRARAIAEEQRALRDPPSKYRPPVTDPASSGVSGAAKAFQDSARGAQKVAADSIRDREKGVVAVNSSMEKSFGGLTDKEFALPSNWREITERRKKLIGPQLTAKEIALLKTLNSVMSVDYSGEKYKAVLDHIQEKTGLTLIMDEASTRDVNLDYDDNFSLKLPKVSVRTVLKKVLGDKGLTYIIKEGNIQVMTPKRAAEHTIVRSYPVDDLIAPNQSMAMFGPFVQQAQMNQNAQQLINLIQFSIEPSYWQPNGPGSITYFPPTRSLLIRGSAEMHYQMSSPGLFGR